MKVFITQFGVPPPASAAIATNIAASPGGQSGATPLTARRNIVNIVGSGNGVLLQVIPNGEMRVYNEGTNALLVFPPQGTAIKGLGMNVAGTIPPGGNATYQFDGMFTWYPS